MLFIGDGTVQVLEISLPNAAVRINSTRVDLLFNGTNTTVNGTWGAGLPQGGNYFLAADSSTNKMVVVGCSVQVNLQGGEDSGFVSSCSTICPGTAGTGSGNQHSKYVWTGGDCSGLHCCQANIPLGYSFYHLHGSSSAGNNKVSVYVTDSVYSSSRNKFGMTIFPEALPATLDWVINESECPANGSAPECLSANSSCQGSVSSIGFGVRSRGYVCSCSYGYQGNPYIPGGCQDMDECKGDTNPCDGDCKNTVGGYTCRCPSGYKGNAYVQNGCEDINECEEPETYSCYGTCLNFPGTFQCRCPNGTNGNPFAKGGCMIIRNSNTGLTIGLGVGIGTSILVVALGAPIITREIKLQKMKKMRQKCFNQNHGLLLKQLISQHADIGERMIVTLRGLEKATNNFDRARVIGGGGHGVVFKGILDLHVVAIKKSKIMVQREIDGFINEVDILSQVNHRNVVKLIDVALRQKFHY